MLAVGNLSDLLMPLARLVILSPPKEVSTIGPNIQRLSVSELMQRRNAIKSFLLPRFSL
jgi:hypothetical protein